MLFALARFDVRVGHQLVWTSESVDSAALPGLEFKMIPSGLHERANDTVYFVCGGYYGVSCYEARVFGPPGSREDTRMYALAALDQSALPWTQESQLRAHLNQYIVHMDLKTLPTHRSPRASGLDHPMQASTAFVRHYGAVVFELWKYGLSRSRVLLSGVGGADVRSMCQFAYVAQQLSAIPEDVLELLPNSHRLQASSPLLYNVTINDLRQLQGSAAFWATTTDTLLLSPERDACDACAYFTGVVDYTRGPPGHRVLPAWRDRRRLRQLTEALRIEPGVQSRSASLLENLVDATASGMMWWASAGESALIQHAEAAESAALLSPVDSPPGLALLGQFQQYTRQLVRVFSRIAQRNAGENEPIRVGITDLAAMGLDPFAKSDIYFLQRFAVKWFDRQLVVGGGLCC